MWWLWNEGGNEGVAHDTSDCMSTQLQTFQFESR